MLVGLFVSTSVSFDLNVCAHAKVILRALVHRFIEAEPRSSIRTLVVAQSTRENPRIHICTFIYIYPLLHVSSSNPRTA